MAATSYPRYIGGERNAPPEDCGGPAGVEYLVYAPANPTDPEVADMVEWLGDYDPEVIDGASIRSALARIAT